MATAIAPSAFSASTSSFHASQTATTGSYSDNPATQLPSVDFNFEDLRQRMAAFTVKFDAFIERGRKRVLEERNEFRGRLSEIGGMFFLRWSLRTWQSEQ
jgi:kinetochore protein Spc25, fungi type